MDTENDKYWRERVEEAERREHKWKDIATAFVNACEIDGFNHVRSANMGGLTRAWENFKELNND